MLVVAIAILVFCLVYVLSGTASRGAGQVAPTLSPRLVHAGSHVLLATKRAAAEGRKRAARMPRAHRGVGRDVPEMLDIVGLGLTAGLSFDAALAEYCQEGEGQLASGLRSAMLSWQMGLSSRRDALMGLADKLGEPSLARFAGSVLEALELGTPLAATLERQARLAREEQRAQVEERIERVPVKMLVPMGTLVVPSMLLAIVGPLMAAMGGA